MRSSTAHGREKFGLERLDLSSSTGLTAERPGSNGGSLEVLKSCRYGECARPVEFPEGNPIQQGELEHFQSDAGKRGHADAERDNKYNAPDVQYDVTN